MKLSTIERWATMPRELLLPEKTASMMAWKSSVNISGVESDLTLEKRESKAAAGSSAFSSSERALLT